MDNEKKKSFLDRMAEKKLEWFIFFLVTALVIVIAWPFCTITIEAGHAGVYFSRFFGGTILNKPVNEGFHLMLPWDKIISYDKRLQSKDYSVTVLTSGGLNVVVDMSVLWYLEPEQVARLHTMAGPDYRERVIDPAVRSTLRSIIGSYEQSRLYDGNPLKLQEDVMVLLKETLQNASFTIHSILIREVKLPTEMANAISVKFVSEQNVLAARYKVLESIETFKKIYVEAEGTRLTQTIVNDGMSEAYLRFMGIHATLELAKSNNTKLVIIGDKDGMPLILNPGEMTASASLPEGLSAQDYIPSGMEGARRNDLIDSHERIQDYLAIIDNVLGDLITKFPEASESTSRVDLPQASQVPLTQN